VGKSIESRLSSLGGENASNAGAAPAPLSRRRFLAGSAALLAGGALVATPGLAKAHNPSSATDIDILNFALTLEHLEYAFYRDGLKTFSAADIKNSKFLRGDGKRFVRNSAYGYLQLIRDHEDTHVDTLTSVIQSLNGTPVPEATYNFKTTAFTSPQKFLEEHGCYSLRRSDRPHRGRQPPDCGGNDRHGGSPPRLLPQPHHRRSTVP